MDDTVRDSSSYTIRLNPIWIGEMNGEELPTQNLLSSLRSD
jgi:hypothetical protein